MNDDQKNYPKILIISNNPLSDNDNNGKTVLSFFRDYPDEKLVQLYFKDEIYSCSKKISHFKISELDMAKKAFPLPMCLDRSRNDQLAAVLPNDSAFRNLISASSQLQIARIVRELIWLTGLWRTKELITWLDNEKPERVFFVAGDSGFAYDVAGWVTDRFRIEMVLFITDDYISPDGSWNVLKILRRLIIKRKLSKAICQCRGYITISEAMRQEYAKVFKRNSIVAMYSTSNRLRKSLSQYDCKTCCLHLVYIGGLQLGRDKVLYRVVDAIDNLNRKRQMNISLQVYARNFKSNKRLTRTKSWIYGGALHTEDDVIKSLESADVELFVETFSRKYASRVRFSLSTKIPEYLSVCKPIFAIGPHYAASMQYLSDCAFCCYSYNSADIEASLEAMLFNKELCGRLSKMAYEKYQDRHLYNETAQRVWNITIGSSECK